MLLKLHIKNFILIKDLCIDFHKGLTTIIGETGAGKSIFLKSLLFLFAKKVSSHVVYNKEELTIITADFDISQQPNILDYLKDNDFILGNTQQLTIKRIISHDSRNKIIINEQPASTEMLSTLANYLCDISTQHNQSKLMDSGTHIEILDSYINDKSNYQKLEKLYLAWQKLNNQYKKLQQQQQQHEHEKFYLQQMISEISALQMDADEFLELTKKRAQIKESSKIFSITTAANKALTEQENSVISELWQIHKNFLKCPEIFKTQEKQLEAAIIELETVNDEVAQISSELAKDQEQTEEIEARFFRIKEIAQKYHVEPNELHIALTESTEKLNNLANSEDDLQNIEKELSKAAENYLHTAQIISNKRQTHAKKLAAAILTEARTMNMAKLDIKINIETTETWSEQGIDHVEILVQTNPGKEFSPIEKVASGGELSRLLLATKLIIAPNNNINKTVIFDEIDAGTGGKTAQIIAKKLHTLSTKSQVILITHQPQIAAISNNLLKVEKHTTKDQAFINADYIPKEKLTKEISYMITGNEHDQESEKTVQQLLQLK